MNFNYVRKKHWGSFCLPCENEFKFVEFINNSYYLKQIYSFLTPLFIYSYLLFLGKV